MQVGDKVVRNLNRTIVSGAFCNIMEKAKLPLNFPLTVKHKTDCFVSFEEITGTFTSTMFIPATATQVKGGKRNPQAVKHTDKLSNGVFRVAGVFDGKARVCKFHEHDHRVAIVPLNPQVEPVILDKQDLNFKLIIGSVSVMCLERWS